MKWEINWRRSRYSRIRTLLFQHRLSMSGIFSFIIVLPWLSQTSLKPPCLAPKKLPEASMMCSSEWANAVLHSCVAAALHLTVLLACSWNDIAILHQKSMANLSEIKSLPLFLLSGALRQDQPSMESPEWDWGASKCSCVFLKEKGYVRSILSHWGF